MSYLDRLKSPRPRAGQGARPTPVRLRRRRAVASARGDELWALLGHGGLDRLGGRGDPRPMATSPEEQSEPLVREPLAARAFPHRQVGAKSHAHDLSSAIVSCSSVLGLHNGTTNSAPSLN